MVPNHYLNPDIDLSSMELRDIAYVNWGAKSGGYDYRNI